MGKTQVQRFTTICACSGSFLSTACPSASTRSDGYARIVGMVYAGCTMDAGSGIRVEQSSDKGATWDYKTEWSMSASSGSAFSVEVVGNAVKITARSSTCNVNPFRMLWELRPV